MGTEVARRGVGIETATRDDFDAKQIATIRATVARGASEPELAMFLEICSRYQLDPFAKQVFFTKMPGRNGQEGRMAIIVGRDGLLTIASRNPEFEGCAAGVVREKDEFEVVSTATDVEVSHVIRGSDKERGKVVGAWAVARRKGRTPRFFYAALDEYLPKNMTEHSPWKKGQTSVMIEKCAISTALRTQFQITGLYDEAELDVSVGEDPAPIPPAEINWPESEALANRLADLFTRADLTVPGSYLPAKIKLTLAGKTEGEMRDLCVELEEFIRSHGGEVPEWREEEQMADDVVEGEAQEEPGGDAEPVTEPEPETGEGGDGEGGDGGEAAPAEEE